MPDLPAVRIQEASLEVLAAWTRDHEEFAALIGSPVPDGWPEFEQGMSLRPTASSSATPRRPAGGLSCSSMSRPGTLRRLRRLQGPPVDREVEIGYEIAPAYRRQGYATAATLAHDQARVRDRSRGCRHRPTRCAEENASTKVLRSSGYEFVAEVEDPDDGPVWRWVHRDAFRPRSSGDHSGSCCNAQVLPSGSLKYTKRPHDCSSTGLASTPTDCRWRERGIRILDHALQALDGARGHLAEVEVEHDRAGRTRGVSWTKRTSSLDGVVVVGAEADLHVEVLRAVDVAHRNGDEPRASSPACSSCGPASQDADSFSPRYGTTPRAIQLSSALGSIWSAVLVLDGRHPAAFGERSGWVGDRGVPHHERLQARHRAVDLDLDLGPGVGQLAAGLLHVGIFVAVLDGQLGQQAAGGGPPGRAATARCSSSGRRWCRRRRRRGSPGCGRCAGGASRSASSTWASAIWRLSADTSCSAMVPPSALIRLLLIL